MVDSIHTKQYRRFCRILVEARKQLGLSQTALAEKLGRLQTFVSKYERGERRLDITEFLEVAKALELDVQGVLRELQARRDAGDVHLSHRIANLSEGQLALLSSIVETFEQPITGKRSHDSDVVSEDFLVAFGDILKLHHTLSDDYLDKHRFEAAMERVYRALGREAARPEMCNPGHDLTVDGDRWSLKTQGDKSIKFDRLYISKFMELGKGRWRSKKDLHNLRDMFLNHMTAYNRIFQLRYFSREISDEEDSSHFYELVEIPKALLQESQSGVFEMRSNSKQNPKPGYCIVTDDDGNVKFKLYFDGGTERKLQIKQLRKELCVVHGTWEF